MKAQIRILSGARAGTTFVFSAPYVAIGRHPESDLQFDPHHDLDVSARHAALVRQGTVWMLRDLGSRNGTLVNGHRIATDTKLDDTDQIRFGPEGPSIELRLVGDNIADAAPPLSAEPAVPEPAPRRAPAATAPGGTPRPDLSRATGGTTQRVRAEVARQTRRLRQFTVLLIAVLLTVVGGFWTLNRQQRLARERDLAALQSEIDSLLRESSATVTELRDELADLASTLARSQLDVQGLQGRLTEAREAGNAERVETLSAELRDALVALAQQQHAARIDFEQIARTNQRAVAMVFVRSTGGRVETATAFGLDPSGLMATNRHVVADAAGNLQARDIAVRFADSRQNFRGEVVAIAEDPDVDLALLRVSLQIPTVQGLNPRPDTVAPGAPVAVIGFPGGIGSPQRDRPDGTYAAASLTAGTVSKNLDDVIQIHGYGSPGASGSPVMDANGHVIAVLFGGEPGSGGRIVYGVPATALIRLLDTHRRGQRGG